MKKRLLTAAVGLTLLVIVLAFHDTVVFDIAIIIVNLIALYEAFINTKKVVDWPIFGIAAAYTVLTPLVYTGYIPMATSVLNIVYVTVMFLVAILRQRIIQLDSLVFGLLISLLLSQSFTCFIMVSHSTNGLFLLLYSFNCAWICDAGAYFVGRKFGKHKLAPAISPKKTIEGAVGGLVASEVFAVILVLVCPMLFATVGKLSLPWVMLLTPVVSIAGIIGDLMASYIKRSTGIKDFGNLLPGHGGILDRFDSMLLIVPMVYIAVQLIN